MDKEKIKQARIWSICLAARLDRWKDYKKYSKAIKTSGIVWNEETLDGFLTKPKSYLKGTKMAFAGLKKEEDRANIIAYLEKFLSIKTNSSGFFKI